MLRRWGGVLLVAAVCAACRSEPRRVVPRDHEAVTGLNGGLPSVERDPEAVTIVVGRAPPPPPVERPNYAHRPRFDYEWIPGYWSWDRGIDDFVWVPGGWVRAPRERAWIAPRWVDLGDGRFRFLPGYWR